MKPRNLIPLLFSFLLLVPQARSADGHWSEQTEQEVRARLAQMDLLFPVHDQQAVMQQIRRFVSSGHRETEYMLGRARHYFPIFEQQLQAAGLPGELKYLSMIESGVRPNAVSPAGAKGMWQMMGATGRHFDLRINGTIDERLDVFKSTEAAVRMLSDLHSRFEEWPLVLAAYNCGPGRVSNAIRKADGRSYPRVDRFLPSETRKYLVRFTAAAYISRYFREHQLEPVSIRPLWQGTAVWVTTRSLDFETISRLTGLSTAAIGQLNPAATKGYWPASEQGNNILLPAKALGKLKAHFQPRKEQAKFTKLRSGSWKLTYVVRPGDDIRRVARLFGVSAEDIREWNQLERSRVYVYQHLDIYLPPGMLRGRA